MYIAEGFSSRINSKELVPEHKARCSPCWLTWLIYLHIGSYAAWGHIDRN